MEYSENKIFKTKLSSYPAKRELNATKPLVIHKDDITESAWAELVEWANTPHRICLELTDQEFETKEKEQRLNDEKINDMLERLIQRNARMIKPILAQKAAQLNSEHVTLKSQVSVNESTVNIELEYVFFTENTESEVEKYEW